MPYYPQWSWYSSFGTIRVRAWPQRVAVRFLARTEVRPHSLLWSGCRSHCLPR